MEISNAFLSAKMARLSVCVAEHDSCLGAVAWRASAYGRGVQAPCGLTPCWGGGGIGPGLGGGGASALAGAGPLTQALGQQGIRKCLGRSEQLSRFWGFSGSDGAMFLPAPGGPDERTVAVSLELHKSDLLTYVGLSMTPQAHAPGCGASYEAVTYWPAACAVVARQVFGNFPVVGAIQRDISVIDAGQASKVFLMPAGVGCVSIKREVLLQ